VADDGDPAEVQPVRASQPAEDAESGRHVVECAGPTATRQAHPATLEIPRAKADATQVVGDSVHQIEPVASPPVSPVQQHGHRMRTVTGCQP
jgi:hypothetical protein